jgi:chromosomal replication initiation ATPase DnaA
MNEVIKIMHEAEEKITAVLGTAVDLSLTVRKNQFPKNYRWDFKTQDEAVDRLMHLVCTEYNVKPEDIVRDTRTRLLTDARGAFGHLAAKLLSMQLNDIASILRRDRTLMYHLFKRAENLISINDPFKRTVNIIENKFLNSNN